MVIFGVCGKILFSFLLHLSSQRICACVSWSLMLTDLEETGSSSLKMPWSVKYHLVSQVTKDLELAWSSLVQVSLLMRVYMFACSNMFQLVLLGIGFEVLDGESQSSWPPRSPQTSARQPSQHCLVQGLKSLWPPPEPGWHLDDCWSPATH